MTYQDGGAWKETRDLPGWGWCWRAYPCDGQGSISLIKRVGWWWWLMIWYLISLLLRMTVHLCLSLQIVLICHSIKGISNEGIISQGNVGRHHSAWKGSCSQSTPWMPASPTGYDLPFPVSGELAVAPDSHTVLWPWGVGASPPSQVTSAWPTGVFHGLVPSSPAIPVSSFRTWGIPYHQTPYPPTMGVLPGSVVWPCPVVPDTCYNSVPRKSLPYGDMAGHQAITCHLPLGLWILRG